MAIAILNATPPLDVIPRKRGPLAEARARFREQLGIAAAPFIY
jgi:hypothetical protein